MLAPAAALISSYVRTLRYLRVHQEFGFDDPHLSSLSTEGRGDRTEKCSVRSSHPPAIASCASCDHLFFSLKVGDQDFCS